MAGLVWVALGRVEVVYVGHVVTFEVEDGAAAACAP
jgi:hypothetical protein